MLSKLILFGVRKTAGGPAQSWVFTTGTLMVLNWAKRKVDRREVVELVDIKPGDRYLIESLNVTHGEQMKAEKLAAKDAKRNKKSHKAALKAARKAAKKS